MYKSKLFSIVKSFLLFLIILREFNCAYSETKTGDSSEYYCVLNGIPLKYEINIDPIRNTSDPVRVSAWTKITVEINGQNCKSNETIDRNFNQIKVNTRNCKIDTKSATVTNLVNEEEMSFMLYNSSLANETNIDFTNRELFITLLKKINLGDHLLFYLPYEFELSREYSEKSWQGLYYYDNREFTATNLAELYNYYPLHSKYMFPVFDHFDSVRKPTFKISVAHYTSDEFISVSNSDIVETLKMSEMEIVWVVDHFRETPPMKLDQITVMILREFQNYSLPCNDVSINKNCTINLWTLRNNSFGNDSIVQTAEEMQKLFMYFERTFNATKYPLSKIDFVAVPWWDDGIDLLANLGIAMSTDYKLLLDEGDLDADADAMKRVSRVLAFQIAQQWFHGMVTLAVPSAHESKNLDIEDFWIEGKGLVNYVAKWPMEEIYHEGVRMRYYSDNIGNNLLFMMESVFTRDLLRSAIGDFYLPKTLHSGASPNDLYDSMQQAIEFYHMTHLLPSVENVTVADIFQSWLNNRDYLPTIKISEVFNYTSSIKLYQVYTAVGGLSQAWWVPIKIRTRKSESILWLSPNNNSTNASMIWTSPEEIDTRTDWLIVNPDGNAYYNVKYSDKLLNNLVNQLELNHSVFSPDGRNYLLQNQFHFLEYDKLETIQSTLQLCSYLGNEMDYHVWSTVIGSMSIYDYIDEPESYKKYFGSKMNTVLEKIGMTSKSGEDLNVAKLRQSLMRMCARAEIPICVDYGKELLSKWMCNSTVNPFKSEAYPDQLYCAVIRDDTEDFAAFHFLLNQLTSTSISDYKGYDLSRALACVKNYDLLNDLISNSSKLLGHKMLLEFYKDTLPDEILLNHPFAMKQAVYDFWIRLTLEGRMLPASLLRRLWQLMPGSKHEPQEFVEKISEFLKNNKDLFGEDLAASVDVLKNEILKLI